MEPPTYKGITSEVGWAFSPTKSKIGATHVGVLYKHSSASPQPFGGVTHVDKFRDYRKTAFTLAEVLITLGIIGVVAALTLPTLIQNHANKVVETRLMKFYSTINQAIQLAEVDYGDSAYWYAKYDDLDTDIKGRPVKGKTDREKWVNKYLAPYMKITETKYADDGYPVFYLADGASFRYTHPTSLSDWELYTKDYFKCVKGGSWTKNMGICNFRFIYSPISTKVSRRSFKPYNYYWDGKVETFKNGITEAGTYYRACNTRNQEYCALYIQYNGWKIPDDYPFKVSY